jgi:hypothetical protein
MGDLTFETGRYPMPDFCAATLIFRLKRWRGHPQPDASRPTFPIAGEARRAAGEGGNIALQVQKSLLLSTTLMAFCTPALAQVGPSTLTMSCQQAHALVASQGAIVLRTGPITYDRYVISPAYCMRAETTEPTWVPTADTPQCFIGYVCRQTDIERGD